MAIAKTNGHGWKTVTILCNMPAPKGNQNAVKGEVKASSWLQVRVEPVRKSGYVRAAQAVRLKLSEWILGVLDNASGQEKPPTQTENNQTK